MKNNKLSLFRNTSSLGFVDMTFVNVNEEIFQNDENFESMENPLFTSSYDSYDEHTDTLKGTMWVRDTNWSSESSTQVGDWDTTWRKDSITRKLFKELYE